SGLSGQDFWSLLHSGYRPVEMVMGSCVYHVAHRGMLSGLGTIGRNVELENFTSAMYEAREIAIERMQYEAANAKAEGVVGVEISRRQPRLADPRDRVFRHRHRGVAAGAGDRAGKNRRPDHGGVGQRLTHFAVRRTPGFRENSALQRASAVTKSLSLVMASSVLNHPRKEADDVEVLLQRRAQPDQGRVVSRRDRPALRSDSGRYPQGRAAQAGLFGDQSERQAAGYRRCRRHR